MVYAAEVSMQKARTQRIHGIEYVYSETSFRVPGKTYPGHKRLYLGKMIDGTFVPNTTFLALSKEQQQATGLTSPPPPPATPEPPVHRRQERSTSPSVGTRLFCGEHLLTQTVYRTLSIEEDLEAVFGATRAAAMLSIAQYLISEPDTPLYRFDRWARIRQHASGQPIASPRSSELFDSITEDEVQRFLKLRLSRGTGKGGWLAVDSTSISSYSQTLALVASGRNKDHDILDQINLLLVFDQEKDIPVFYRLLRGCIPDVSTMTHTLDELKGLGCTGVSMVMDRGFYSEHNIGALLKMKYRFTIGVGTSVGYVRKAIAEHRRSMQAPASYDEARDVFFASVPVSFDVPVQGKTPIPSPAHLHVYYSKEREAAEVKVFLRRLRACKEAIAAGTKDSQSVFAKTYFTTVKNKRGQVISCTEKADVIRSELDQCGFFALLTSETLPSSDILTIYRTKDRVEKAFNNLKDRLSLRRTGCSSETAFRGKVFVQFIALMILSHIQRVMKQDAMYTSYTFRELLDEVMPIEYVQYAGKKGQYGEITEKQAAILRRFNVPLPDSAWPTRIRKEIQREKKKAQADA
jgi:hypothetical protein